MLMRDWLNHVARIHDARLAGCHSLRAHTHRYLRLLTARPRAYAHAHPCTHTPTFARTAACMQPLPAASHCHSPTSFGAALIEPHCSAHSLRYTCLKSARRTPSQPCTNAALCGAFMTIMDLHGPLKAWSHRQNVGQAARRLVARRSGTRWAVFGSLQTQRKLLRLDL